MNPDAGDAHAPGGHVRCWRERTGLWIRAGLVDLYDPMFAEDLVDHFGQFLAEHATALFPGSVLDWDRVHGRARLHQGHSARDVTAHEWNRIADIGAFDQWLARREAAEKLLRLALAQLARIGVHAQVDGSSPGAPVILMAPGQVLTALEHAVRARIGTASWNHVDRHTAEFLLGVGHTDSPPERDAAIRSAADPWQAALRFATPSPARTSLATERSVTP